jgi:Ribosomal protein L24E
MHSENMTHHQSDWEECAVCGNCVEPGHGSVRINHHGNTVCLCNPTCLGTFAQEPDPYLARLAKRMRERQLQESPKTEGRKSGQDEGFDSGAAYQVRK